VQVANNKWIEIDVDAINSNLEQITNNLDQQHTRLIAVIKADAYGHGAAEVARILFNKGVNYFAVTYLQEALELRHAGIDSDILIFTPIINESDLKIAIDNKLTLTLTSYYDSQLLIGLSDGIENMVKVHIKIDTGLSRFGVKPDNKEEIYNIYYSLKQVSCVYIEGIYTHMAHSASSSSAYTQKQFASFMKVIEDLESKGYEIPMRHCANSAVFLKYGHMHLDAVRIGTLLSGQYPVGNFHHNLVLKDPFVFKCRLISVKSLSKGSYLGYYKTFKLKKSAKIGVIPVGYRDGLALEIANKPAGILDLIKTIAKTILRYLDSSLVSIQVKVCGKSYPVRGKVFMQSALIEFPADASINTGDEVEVPIKKILAGKDIERRYIRGKQTKEA